MILKRKRMGLVAAAVLAMLNAAQADSPFPSRPITLIVPFAAGGPVDVSVFQAIDALRSSSECESFERLALVTSACTINAMQSAGQSKIHEYLAPSGDTMWMQGLSTATGAAPRSEPSRPWR